MNGLICVPTRTRRALEVPTGLRSLCVTVVILWMGAASSLAVLLAVPTSFAGGEDFPATVAYWSAAVFAAFALCYAVSVSWRGQRVFWALLGIGLALRVLARTL